MGTFPAAQQKLPGAIATRVETCQQACQTGGSSKLLPAAAMTCSACTVCQQMGQMVRDASSQTAGGAPTNGSSQYKTPDSLTDNEKEELFHSDMMASFLGKILPRWNFPTLCTLWQVCDFQPSLVLKQIMDQKKLLCMKLENKRFHCAGQI